MFDFGDRLLMVATDRISAFDWVLPTGIPDKGRVLNQLSRFWFQNLKVRHHMLSTNPQDLPLPNETNYDELDGRSMIVQKTEVVPFECVVRGYLSGSGWKEYRQSQSICGVQLPPGLRESERLPQPIFTPTTKAEKGHDLPITFTEMCASIGEETAERLRDLSIDIYNQGFGIAASKGILIADTKFEFGRYDSKLWLIDEVLTPDSSRFWPADQYEPGRSQSSFDKQFVRDWLEASGWDKNSNPPELPEDVVDRTRAKYIEAFERITGESFQ
jgi:phosphoribosylaminoimidazole-succinocarboxamide synthase